MPVLIDESPSKRRPTQFSADTIIRPAPQPDRRLARRGHRGARRPGQQAHRAPQAQGHRRPHQLLASRRLLHPRPTRPLRRARPVVLRRGPLLPRAGILIATAETFVNHAEAGHFADELDNLLGVGTQDALRKLVADARLTRHKLAGQFSTARLNPRSRRTRRARRLLLATPVHPPSVGAPRRESALETVRRSRSAYSTPSTIARET